MNPPVSYSRFPARVTLPDGRTLDKVAVIVTGGVARLYTKAEVEVATLTNAGDPVNVEDAHTLKITGTEGAWMIRPGTQCGCNGALRRWFTTFVTHKGT